MCWLTWNTSSTHCAFFQHKAAWSQIHRCPSASTLNRSSSTMPSLPAMRFHLRPCCWQAASDAQAMRTLGSGRTRPAWAHCCGVTASPASRLSITFNRRSRQPSVVLTVTPSV